MSTELMIPQASMLARISTEELRSELARGLTLTAETLTRLGMVWAELERRGEDLSELRHGIARTLPLIASGRLAAEAVVAFAGRAVVLRALEGVPLEKQRALAAGEPVQVIDPTDPVRVTEMPLASIPAAVVNVVIGDGEVRPPATQRLAFRPRPKRRSDDENSTRRFRPRYNRENGTITVGKMTVPLADFLSVLSAAAGPDHPPAADLPGEYATVKTRLSKEEAARFTAACRRAELPDWEMIRKALRAFGLI